ncbi:hypothetical protein KIPB_012647, partial [Kipferlia bialata]|eukprot:g12647.t1
MSDTWGETHSKVTGVTGNYQAVSRCYGIHGKMIKKEITRIAKAMALKFPDECIDWPYAIGHFVEGGRLLCCEKGILCPYESDIGDFPMAPLPRELVYKITKNSNCLVAQDRRKRPSVPRSTQQELRDLVHALWLAQKGEDHLHPLGFEVSLDRINNLLNHVAGNCILIPWCRNNKNQDDRGERPPCTNMCPLCLK